MANEGRLGREGLVVAHRYPDADTAARLAREAVVVAHHYPEASTAGRLGRLALVIAISWPHGWDIFDDPGLSIEGIGEGPVEGGDDDVTPPAVPSGLTAAAGDTFIFLNWTSNGELDMASYKVYQSSTETGTYTVIATVDVSEETVTGLTNGQTYWFKVSAVDSTGNESALTVAVSGVPVVPPVGVAPAVPTGLTATAGDTIVVLNWADNTETDLASYNVYRATASGGPYTSIATGRTLSDYTATGLTNGTAYWFKVSAVDTGANESAQSSSVTAIPAAVTPPTGLPLPADVVFDSSNLYTAAKVTAEAAGTSFQFTVSGGNSNGPRYESATIPTKAGNQYVFDAGTVLDGNGTVALAFAIGVNDVEIYDCEWTDYLGQNSSGVNNTKGAAAIRLRTGWKLYRGYGHHNKYSAFSTDGDTIYVEDGDVSYNGQYGFKGSGDDNEVKGLETHHNGGITSLDIGGDTGGCKIVHSERFKFTNIEAHHNIATGTQGGNGLWTDINNLDPVYDGCNIHDNDGAGIFHEVSLGAEIKNCTLTNNGQDNSDGGIHPVKGNIQLSNSGGGTSPGGAATLWVHDNTITITSGALGHYGISMFNSNHFQWTASPTNVDKGCLGARNMLIENNTINISGSQWKAAMAITGNLPTSRNASHQCGQLPITASGSNNVIRNNTVILTGGQHPSTPYIRAGVRISANAWLGFGYT